MSRGHSGRTLHAPQVSAGNCEIVLFQLSRQSERLTGHAAARPRPHTWTYMWMSMRPHGVRPACVMFSMHVRWVCTC